MGCLLALAKAGKLKRRGVNLKRRGVNLKLEPKGITFLLVRGRIYGVVFGAN
jgi:hypothetical protein